MDARAAEPIRAGPIPPPSTWRAEAPPPLRGPRLRLVLIGRMEAWGIGSIRVLPRSRKARALLAALGLDLGTPLPRLRAAELLWSQRGEVQARASLRQAVHELQAALAPIADAHGTPALVATREHLLLPAEQVWVDAIEIGRDRADRPAPLDLLTGELLADLGGIDPAFDAWLLERRRALRATAAAAAARLLAAADGPAATIVAARRALAVDPAHEASWRALIGAEAARGDRAAALAAYAECRALLAGGLGTAPSAETEALAVTLRATVPSVIVRAPSAPTPAAPPARGARLGVPPLRSIGVAADCVAPHLAAGLAEEITAALARFRWLFVVDPVSLAAAAATSGEERAARALRLDFLLAGSVQAVAGRLRIALRLTDLRPPAGVVWTGRFDREATDLLALQDEIASEVVARIDPEILLIEANRAAARPRVDASAYDLLLRAIAAIHRLDQAEFLAAGEWLATAILREPGHAPAHAWHAYWYLFLIGQGWAGEGAAVVAAVAAAERAAARAVALDPLDAHALSVLGHVRAFLQHRAEEAAALHDRALALNPNHAAGWVFAGMAASYLGRHGAALERLDRYKQLAPCHPHAFFFDAARGIPLLCLARHEEAVAVGRAATALAPGFSYPFKTYLAALGHLGATAEAAAVRDRLLAIEPGFTLAEALRRTPLRREPDRAHYAAGLAAAGIA